MSEPPPSDQAPSPFRTPWVIEVDGKPQVRYGIVAAFAVVIIGLQLFLAASMTWIGGVPFRLGLVATMSAGILAGFTFNIELLRQRILAKRFVFRIGLAASFILMTLAGVFFAGLSHELRVTRAGHAENERISKELKAIIVEGTIGGQSPHSRAIVCHVTRKSFSDADLIKVIESTTIEGENHLTFLAISGTNVTAAGLERLGECRNLEHLDVYGLPLTEAALAAIERCDKLKYLTIGSNRLSPEQLAQLRAALPKTTIDGVRPKR